MKICKSCNYTFEDKFNFCSVCGKNLEHYVEPVFCGNCGKQIDSNVAFCPYCGSCVSEYNVIHSIKSANENPQSNVEPLTVAPNLARQFLKDGSNLSSESAQYNSNNQAVTVKKSSQNSNFGYYAFLIGLVLIMVIANSFGKILSPNTGALSRIVFGMATGVVCGLLPLFLGKKWEGYFKNNLVNGANSFWFCVLVGGGGILFTIPASIFLSLIMYFNVKRATISK